MHLFSDYLYNEVTHLSIHNEEQKKIKFIIQDKLTAKVLFILMKYVKMSCYIL